ncbi:MAG: hypothetical protein KGH81_07820 [Thaumarchaeota archaeon]|nr:hypothetical protein [Nitrososphaerota archaeon]
MKGNFKPNAQVLARIIEAFYQNNSMKKTHLHFASRTDWNSFERYVNWLQVKNYVECSSTDECVYKLTSSGRDVFNMIMDLQDNIKKLQSIISI